ncbi:MAG: DNA-formamidopyrimidine glycosylase family protein [Dehalococcoidia bacterium]|jgi:formamidopyrimidine-DNA glycosylase|nr:DNA-formamidopyrimidine glycosylase family protein [Dehalococcoidia bacterium]
MPEIPDLEAICGFMNQHLAGLAVAETELRFPWLVRSEDGLDRIAGHRFESVHRYGKFLIFEWDGDIAMVVNPMLTGRFTWADPSERRRPATAITIVFAGGNELRYSDQRKMGRWYVVPSGEVDSVPGFADLGPDALEIDEETFVAQLRRRRGMIKNTLTNQKFMAGIGNAYSDEILWEAKLHPHRTGSTLDDDDRRELYRAMHATFDWARPLLEAQVSERLYQRNEEWRDHLRVHRQEGEPCPRCGSAVKAQVRSGRETNYCLTCQPLFA